MKLLGDEGEGEQADALFAAQGEVDLLGVADALEDGLHLVGGHAGAVVLDGDAFEGALVAIGRLVVRGGYG